MLIRLLPVSLYVISTVASAQADMTLESLNALVRAELDQKKSRNSPQGKGKEIKANFAEHNRSSPLHQGTQIRKRVGKCHHCGKSGHYKSEAKKFKA